MAINRTIGYSQLSIEKSALFAQLSTPDRTGKNDIMAACLKYCVYLKDISIDSLTLEENEFMKTMEEIDIWYENQMNQAKLEGE